MYRIGIDIGGTQLRIALIDADYKIVEVYKTANDRAQDAKANCAPLVDWIRAKQDAGYELAGIGIGSPGPLDLRAGKVLNPPNLVGWDNFEIVRFFQEATGLPTFLNNDANVAGLSEALIGGGKGYESVIFVGLSTGFGGAFVYRGELINGAHGNTAEYWNSIVCDDPNGRGSANPGSLNENAGGTGITRVATVRFGRPMEPKELFDLYYAGDPTALEVFDYCTEMLARGLANIFWNFDPDVVVVGGSIDLYHPIYLQKALEKAARYMPAPDSLHIEKAVFGDDAGLIGAALLVKE
jgi:glucokinase